MQPKDETLINKYTYDLLAFSFYMSLVTASVYKEFGETKANLKLSLNNLNLESPEGDGR